MRGAKLSRCARVPFVSAKGTKTAFAGRDPVRLRLTGPLRFSIDGARGPNSLRSNMGRSPAPPPCDARLALRLERSKSKINGNGNGNGGKLVFLNFSETDPVVCRPEGRRPWMGGVFRPSHGWRVGKSRRTQQPRLALSGKAFFFGSFLLTLIKRNEPAKGGSLCP